MEFLDLAIIIGFFGITILLGYYQGRKTQNASSTRDFFLGGGSIPWYILSISLVATETSTLTFLGIPALSYIGDYSFLSLALGFILGRILSAFFILPLYTKSPENSSGSYTSIYEWVGEKFGNPSQKTLSLFFAIIRILSDGVRLYAASLPLSFLLVGIFPVTWTFNQISIVSLVILSTATILYSAYGGFRAVVWTDFLQFLVYGIGGILVLWLLIDQTGSPMRLLDSDYLMKTGLTSERFTIFRTDLWGKNGLLDPYFFVFSILGGILLSFGSHGTDQMIVQRLLACRSLRESRLALISSGILVFFQFGIFLLIGTYLFLQTADVTTPVASPNRVFSDYIVNHLPTPLLGFILAGVFASSMSTLSSTLNSLTLTTQVDWKFGNPKSSLHSGLITVFWGGILLFASTLPFFLDETSKANIVELGLSFASFVFGPMIALFGLEVFNKLRINETKLNPSLKNFHFPLALISGVITTTMIHGIYHPPFTWMVGIGIIGFYIYYYALGMIFRNF